MNSLAARGLVALLLALGAAVPSAAEDNIVGIASVIDDDTIEMQASFALADQIGRATVRCELRDIDRYRRVVAVCLNEART
jgi:endonuclease YncB( thermonuclease family)